MKEYFVCKLTTGEEIDFNKKATAVKQGMENNYVVYDEAGNMIGIVPDTYAICFYKTTDKCEEKWTPLDGSMKKGSVDSVKSDSKQR